MSHPSKRAVRHVYLLNPAREPEQEQMIYVPVDVWRDLLFMTGVGLFFGVGKASNVKGTGEVLSPLVAKDQRGLPLVERGPRALPPSPDQATPDAVEPYPGLGLHQHGVGSVVALTKVEAEVIGKMLRAWANLETSRTAHGGLLKHALVDMRKQRKADEDRLDAGRASQWTVPPHGAWCNVAQQIGDWLCVQTPNPTDIYLGMNPDELVQAATRDRLAHEEALGMQPAKPAPSPAEEALLARLRTELPGEWSHGGARGALLWVFPFAIAVRPVAEARFVLTAEHLRDIDRRTRVTVGWGGLRDNLACLVAETVCHRLWGALSADIGPVWARVEVLYELAKLREQLTTSYDAKAPGKVKMVAMIDEMLSRSHDEAPAAPSSPTADCEESPQ